MSKFDQEQRRSREDLQSVVLRARFVETAKTVRQGGSWIVLGVGPGKTTRIGETVSPVDSILAERGAKHININILRYFSEPATLDDEAKARSSSAA